MMRVQPKPRLLRVVALVGALLATGLPPATPSEAQRPATSQPALAFSGYVVDQADVLSAEERRKLTERLGRFERDTHHQIAIVTIADLGGEDVGAFTTRLANRWGVGRKGFDDGVVILVAPLDRKARIAVGRGLEQQLPDAFCREVLQQEMLPAFARGEFGSGILKGTSTIIGRLSVASAAAR